MRPMLKAIIFDFNGVILDDEPLHFAAMRDAVAEFGIDLTREAYWDRYLPMDDAACLQAVCRDNHVPLDEGKRKKALESKVRIYNRLLQNHFPLFPGAVRFIRAAGQRYPLAMASGARREEIEATLDAVGLSGYFTVIVAAEDFSRGKPHPESFLLALERLNAKMGRLPAILPGECLVIEDSVGGVKGAQAAGMVCLAISNSYPRDKLSAADRIAASLEEVQLDSLQALFGEPV